MKFLLKIVVVLLIAVVLFSSYYVVFFMESEDSVPTGSEGNGSQDNENNDSTGDNDNDNDNENDNGDSEFVHTIFVEEGTSATCVYCPNVGDILYELFNPDDPEFYYVSMVLNEGTKADNRMYDEYNTWGLPTTFIDGGYRVVFGAKDKSRFENDLSKAASRKVPKLILNLYAEWSDNKSELTTTVTLENKESETYNGRLMVYITEILSSRWEDYNGNPYHFAFLDYAIDKDIKVKADENITIPGTWIPSNAGYSNVYPENLWIMAVVFNSESKEKLSDSKEDGGINKHFFDAHYADATDGARVAEGELPPAIGISAPKNGYRYIYGKEGGKVRFLKKTWMFGKITIKTNVVAESGVEKVEFSIKGLLREITGTATEEPYEFIWDTFAFGKYTITVIVYDKEGKTATDSIEVLALNLKQE